MFREIGDQKPTVQFDIASLLVESLSQQRQEEEEEKQQQKLQQQRHIRDERKEEHLHLPEVFNKSAAKGLITNKIVRNNAIDRLDCVCKRLCKS